MSRLGCSPFYTISVNCLYRDRVSGRVTDRVRFRRPDSSGNLLIRRKMDYARPTHGHETFTSGEESES